MDGGEQVTSIHGMFPKELWKECTAPSNETYETLKKQEYAYAPSSLGTIERLEDGVRYVYQTSCDPENKEVIYSKFVYDTNQLIKQVIYDADTGELK